jgi:2-polyprenyl-6-methoxyphenol hydroxylase-like FAD-dependent oxidoreductase
MTHLPSDSPVVIAGGGPVGLAAAVELGQRGIDCLVLEPRAQVSMLRPRAKTTSVRTMEHFRRWGLASRIRAIAPLPVAWSQEVVFCTSLLGREITRIEDCFGLTTTRREEFAEAGQQIPQPLVEQVLREAVAELPSVTFATDWTLVGLEERTDDVLIQASGPSEVRQSVRAAYLLGCEGSASPTRAAIGSRYVGDTDARPNINIVFRAPGLAERVPHGPAIHYWVINPAAPGLVGRMDLTETWWTILMGVDAAAGQRDPRNLIEGLIGGDFGSEVEVISTDPWTARMLLANAYQTERVFLVGDAAHQNPPWGGHGFNTGIGDAVNIGWKLAATLLGWGGPELLRSYAEERQPVARETIEVSRANMSVLSNDLTKLVADPEAIRRAKDGEFHSMGLVLGYAYDRSPIVGARWHSCPYPRSGRLSPLSPPRCSPSAHLVTRRPLPVRRTRSRPDPPEARGDCRCGALRRQRTRNGCTSRDSRSLAFATR